MEVPGVSSSTLSAIANTSTQTGDAVTISVMKKAMDIQAQSAAQLIAAAGNVAPPPQADPASSLGQNLDVRV